MATMRDVVTKAYRKIGVGGSGEALEAEQADEGIDALNDMLHEWKLRGVDITHTDKGMSETFPMDPEYVSGTVYMLAARISSDYTVPANFDEDDFFRAIQAAHLTIDAVEFDKALDEVPSLITEAAIVNNA